MHEFIISLFKDMLFSLIYVQCTCCVCVCVCVYVQVHKCDRRCAGIIRSGGLSRSLHSRLPHRVCERVAHTVHAEEHPLL